MHNILRIRSLGFAILCYYVCLVIRMRTIYSSFRDKK